MSVYDITNGNAYDLLRLVPARSVDVIVTDPPYNLGPYSTGNIALSWRKPFNNDIADWDREFDPALVVDDFVRVLKPTGTMFAFTTYNLLGRWHEVFDPIFDTFQFMVWHKTNPPPKIRRAGFLNSCELIVCAWNKGHLWNFTRQRDMHNFIESPICMGKERWRNPVHPTQKPVKVLKHLIRLAARPGALVLDPFMGVGSTGVAAIELACRFIGFEIDPAYFKAAEQRLAAAAAALRAPLSASLFEHDVEKGGDSPTAIEGAPGPLILTQTRLQLASLGMDE